MFITPIVLKINNAMTPPMTNQLVTQRPFQQPGISADQLLKEAVLLFILLFQHLLASIGTRVKATISEASSE